MATLSEIKEMNLSAWVDWFDAPASDIKSKTTYTVPLQRGEQYTYVVKYDAATFGTVAAVDLGMQICLDGARIIGGVVGSPQVVTVGAVDYITMTFTIQPVVVDGAYNLCIYNFNLAPPLADQPIFESSCVTVRGSQRGETQLIRYRCSSNSCFNFPYGDIVAARASYYESFRVNAMLQDMAFKDDTEVDSMSNGETRVRYNRTKEARTWRLGYVDERIFRILTLATRFDTFEIWDDDFQEWVSWTRDESEAFAPEHPDNYPRNINFTAQTKLLRDDVDLVNTY